MANNTILNVGLSGDVISNDQITTLNGAGIATGEKVQRMKLAFGAPGAATDISTAAPLPVIDNDTVATGTITAAAQTVSIVLNSDSAGAIQITGVWVGTFQFEGTLDGTNWVAINAVAASTSFPQPTTTVNGIYRLTPSGLAQIRINATAWTSGTATISIRASAGTGGTFFNQVAPVRISDGTTSTTVKPASTAAIATDPAIVVAISPNNNILTDPIDRAARLLGTVSIAVPSITYSAVANSLGTIALGTDLITIYGSATKTVNILNIWVTGVQTTAGQVQVLLIKRSTANTGGTSAALVKVPYDSNDAAATATVLAYSANPTTLGTIIGNIRGDRLFLPGAASTSDAQGLTWSFVNGKQMTLRGVAQGICINLGGVTIAGGSINVTIEWQEI